MYSQKVAVGDMLRDVMNIVIEGSGTSTCRDLTTERRTRLPATGGQLANGTRHLILYFPRSRSAQIEAFGSESSADLLDVIRNPIL